MKHNSTLLMLALILMLLNSSCIHYYYAPNSNNVPLFKEKNEARIQASYTSTGAQANYDGATGFEIQSAYAVGDHAAVQLNIMHVSEDDEEYGSGNGTYIEGAGGYYKPFGQKHNLVFETYGGIGTGNVKNIYKDGNSGYKSAEVSTSVTKFFVQPSIGFTSTYFSVAFSSKFSLLNLKTNNSNLSSGIDEYDYEYVESLKNGKSYFFWEPGLMIRAGFKNLQVVTQITETVMDDKKTLPFSNGNISFGVIIPINSKHK
jgi:hypothetical protein